MSILRCLLLVSLLAVLATGCSRKGGDAVQSQPPTGNGVAGIPEWADDPFGALDRPAGDVLTGVVETGKNLVLSLDGVRLIARSDLLPVGTVVTLKPSTSIPAEAEVQGTPFTIELQSPTPLPKLPLFHLETTIADLPGSAGHWRFSGWKHGGSDQPLLQRVHPDLLFMGGSSSHGVLRMMVKYVPGQTCALVNGKPLTDPVREAASRGPDIPTLVPADMGAPPETKHFQLIIAHGTDGVDAELWMPPFWSEGLNAYCDWHQAATGSQLLQSPMLANLTPAQKADTQIWWWLYESDYTEVFPISNSGVPQDCNSARFAQAIKTQIMDPNPDAQLILAGHSQGGLQCLAAYDYLTNPANASALGRSQPYEECILAGFLPMDSPLRGIEFASIGLAIPGIINGTQLAVAGPGPWNPLAFVLLLADMPGWAAFATAVDLYSGTLGGISGMGCMYEMDIEVPGGWIYRVGGNLGMEQMWDRLKAQSSFTQKFTPIAGYQPFGWVGNVQSPSPPPNSCDACSWWAATRPLNSLINKMYDTNGGVIVDYTQDGNHPRTVGPIYTKVQGQSQQMTDSLVLYWSQQGTDLDQWKKKPHLPPHMHECEHGCLAQLPYTQTMPQFVEPTVSAWMSTRMSELMTASEPCTIDLVTNGRMDLAMHWDSNLGQDLVTIACIGTHDGLPYWPYLIQSNGQGGWREPQRMPQLNRPIGGAEAYAVSLLEYQSRWVVMATGGNTNMVCGVWLTEGLNLPSPVRQEYAYDMGMGWTCGQGQTVPGDCLQAFELDSAIIHNTPMLALGTRNGYFASNAVQLYAPVGWPVHEGSWSYPSDGVMPGDDAWLNEPSAHSVSLTAVGEDEGALATTYSHHDPLTGQPIYSLHVYDHLTRLIELGDVPDPDYEITTPTLAAAKIRDVNGELYVVYATSSEGRMAPECVSRLSGYVKVLHRDELFWRAPYDITHPVSLCEECNYAYFQDRVGFEVFDNHATVTFGNLLPCDGNAGAIWVASAINTEPAVSSDWTISMLRSNQGLPGELTVAQRHDGSQPWIGAAASELGKVEYSELQP
ncbi:MAG: hypothetical protein ABI743_00040 [bacterium]